MTTCSSPPPSTLRSSTCGQISLLWSPVAWPTPRPRCPCTGKSPQRRSQPIKRWWPMTPPRDLCCRIQAKSIRGSSTARPRPGEPLRSPPNISCSTWKVEIHSCLVIIERADNNAIVSLTVPSGPPYVSLEVSPESVRGGDNINVTCTALGEPEEDMNFSWIYPGQVNIELGSKAKHLQAIGLPVSLHCVVKVTRALIAKDQRPVHTHTSWRLVKRGTGQTTRVSKSVLTIEDMETIDFGNYICRAKNGHGETIVMTIISKNLWGARRMVWWEIL